MTYWQKRNLDEVNKLYDTSQYQIEAQIARYYEAALKKTISNFEALYDKYLALKAANKEITPNTIYQLERYYQMEQELSQTLEKLGSKTIRTMTRGFEENYSKTVSTIKIPNKTIMANVNIRGAKDAVNTIWCADGKSFSERVWINTSKLQQALNESLINTIITGQPTSELKKQLMHDFGVSFNRADAVVRTELAHVQSVAAQDRYKQYGIQEMEVCITEDERLCEECSAMEGKKFLVDEPSPVPLHVRCRCALLPVVS